jgi:hypothetical protein
MNFDHSFNIWVYFGSENIMNATWDCVPLECQCLLTGRMLIRQVLMFILIERFVRGLFNNAVSSSDYKMSDERMVMNNELGRILKMWL